MSFLVGKIMNPPLGLITTDFTLENIITVLCCYVFLKTSSLCSLIFTLITGKPDTYMFFKYVYP